MSPPGPYRDTLGFRWVAGILLYAATVQFFWLNYPSHFFAWVLYHFHLLMY